MSASRIECSGFSHKHRLSISPFQDQEPEAENQHCGQSRGLPFTFPRGGAILTCHDGVRNVRSVPESIAVGRGPPGAATRESQGCGRRGRLRFEFRAKAPEAATGGQTPVYSFRANYKRTSTSSFRKKRCTPGPVCCFLRLPIFPFYFIGLQ